jgi:hypothetical protein
MKIEQFIYTSYRSTEPVPKGYDIFTQTDGASEKDISEIIDRLQRYPTNDSRLRASDITQSVIDEITPKNYAYLKLASGKNCIACVSLNDKDYSGRAFPIYIHAAIIDGMPLNPMEFIDGFKFRFRLTDDEFYAKVEPPKLDTDIKLLGKSAPKAYMDFQKRQKLLNAIFTGLEENKQIFINTDKMIVLETLKDAFYHLPDALAKQITFSSFVFDRDSSKGYKICHIANDFSYANLITNSALIICDFEGGNYSKNIKEYKITPYLLNGNASEFLNTYINATPSYSLDKAVSAYEFLYTDEYIAFTEQKITDLLQDDFVKRAENDKTTASRILAYLQKNKIKSNYQLYSVAYSLCADKNALIREVFYNIIEEMKNNDLSKDAAKKALKTVADIEIESVIYADYATSRNVLIDGIENKNIFNLIIDTLKSRYAVSDSKKTEGIYYDLFNIFIKRSPDGVRDVFLPAISFDAENWRRYFEAYYRTAVVDKNTFVKFLPYLKSLNGSQLPDSKCFDIVNEAINKYKYSGEFSIDDLISALKVFSPQSSQYISFLELINDAFGEGGLIQFCNDFLNRNPGETKTVMDGLHSKTKLQSAWTKLIADRVQDQNTFIEFLLDHRAEGIYKDLTKTLFDRVKPSISDKEFWIFCSKIFAAAKGKLQPNGNSFIGSLNKEIQDNILRIPNSYKEVVSKLCVAIEAFGERPTNTIIQLIIALNGIELNKGKEALDLAKKIDGLFYDLNKNKNAQDNILRLYAQEIAAAAFLLFNKNKKPLFEELLQRDKQLFGELSRCNADLSYNKDSKPFGGSPSRNADLGSLIDNRPYGGSPIRNAGNTDWGYSLEEPLHNAGNANSAALPILYSVFKDLKAKKFLKLEKKINKKFKNEYDANSYLQYLSDKQKNKVKEIRENLEKKRQEKEDKRKNKGKNESEEFKIQTPGMGMGMGMGMEKTGKNKSKFKLFGGPKR